MATFLRRAESIFRHRRFQIVALLLCGLLWTGCSLLSNPGQSSNPPSAAGRPTASIGAAAGAPTRTARATTRRTTASPRATARRATASPRTTRQRTPTTAIISAAQPIAGFSAVTPDELPPEARTTLALIDKGGPFPYRQDGVVFQNRERLLPRKANGYYHEYTVRTPGEDDRGARRIITGEDGELFYTDDHYDSFVQVLP